jgi:aminoglycoside phosphotransferase
MFPASIGAHRPGRDKLHTIARIIPSMSIQLRYLHVVPVKSCALLPLPQIMRA